jgi:hypothetical protein
LNKICSGLDWEFPKTSNYPSAQQDPPRKADFIVAANVTEKNVPLALQEALARRGGLSAVSAISSKTWVATTKAERRGRQIGQRINFNLELIGLVDLCNDPARRTQLLARN